MRFGKTLIRTALTVFIGVSLLLVGGCASDRQVISQAEQTHAGLQPAVITDPQLATYIQSVGDRIIAAAQQATKEGYHAPTKSNEDSSWMFSNQMKFHFVASDQLNAFTTGGEHMYVYTQLFQLCRSEDELAAVMAHEFAHVYGRHVHKGMNRQYAMMGAAAAAGATGYAVGKDDQRLTYAAGFAGAAMAAGQFVGMGYTRNDEREADDMGFDFYVRAGWDPAHFADFFKQMIEKGYDKTPEMMSDHPSLASRVQTINAKVAKLGPSSAQLRKAPVADKVQLSALQQRSQQVVAAMPKNDATKGAGLLLASFPSCVASVDTPTQKDAQQRVQAIVAKSKQQTK